ncbi:MAG: hypothetical protein J5824_01700 [Lachnospiraceae bacterium]|nr:hypothetical protein [Lachnospiraceae bacterium]
MKQKVDRESKLDEIYKRRKGNNRNMLAPLYIYEILKEKTDYCNSMSRNEIQERLAKAPYELVMERKAILRTVNLLVNESNLHVYCDRKGVWYDPNDYTLQLLTDDDEEY